MNDSVSPLTAKRQASPPQKSHMRRLAQLLLQGDRPYALYGAFAILLVVFSFASPWFLSIDNFLNIGRQTALVSIVAIGMTL
jgi:Ribose/xylose/arabinose/galactoside ABC-type transport systems, permease components